MGILIFIIALTTGLLVLAGYFVPALAGLQTILLGWASIAAAMAAIVGALSLISVHGDKVRRRGKGSIYSAVLLLGLFISFIPGLILGSVPPGLAGPIFGLLFKAIILPSQAALMSLLAITLLYSAVRLLRRRPDLMSIVFLISASLILLGSATLPLPFGGIPILSDLIRPWLTQILALGGARGILIGVALGSLLTGLRVLFGADRPYGGK
ncbi:MAG: hypothetical protein MUO77_21095 [Anaerolineales bacterium]|nr:hypothetical protein [Anaerolineales bacterium]